MTELLARIIFFAVLFACIPLFLRLISETARLIFALIPEALSVAILSLFRFGMPLLLSVIRAVLEQGFRGFIFARIFIEELRGLDNHDESAGEEDHPDDPFEQKRETVSYIRALKLLDLEPGCTPEQLKAAHRRAIMSAHPDRGGSEEMARAINEARTVIRAHYGWT